jgi:hypothetical protein
MKNKGQNHTIEKMRAKPQLHFKAGTRTQMPPKKTPKRLVRVRHGSIGPELAV